MMKKLHIDEELSALWKKLLGNVEVTKNSSFFDLGGDDFLYSALLSLINKKFILSFPEQSKQCHIFSKQAQLIKELLNEETPEALIKKLNAGNSRVAFIFIHPLGGTLFNYMNLIKTLDKNFSIYGIQDRMYIENFQPFSSLSEQAKSYREQIQTAVTEKTLILVGHSSGGTIAYEIAQQLLKTDKYSIKQVVMFDSWIEIPNQTAIKNSLEKIMLRQINSFNRDYFSINNFSTGKWLEIITQRIKTLFEYKPQKTNLNVTLFIPLNPVPEYQPDQNLSNKWRKYVENLTVLTSEGNHETMLDKNNLTNIINYFSKLFTEATNHV